MKIRRVLAVTEIPLLMELVGGDESLEKEVIGEFESAETSGQALFVRYERGQMQRMHVDIRLLLTPEGHAKVMNHKWWEWKDEEFSNASNIN